MRSASGRAPVASLVALLAAVVGVMASPNPTMAQRGLDIERRIPALDPDGFVAIAGTRSPEPSKVILGASLSMASEPLTRRDADGTTEAVIDLRTVTDLSAAVGIDGRLGLGLDVPLVAYQVGHANVLGDGGPAIPATALGDPRVSARYRFWGESSSVARDRNEGPGLAMMLTTFLPLGDEEAFAGERGVRADLQALADFHVLGAGAGLSLGYRHRFVPHRPARRTFRDELSAGFGLEVPIPVMPNFGAVTEVRVVTDAASPFGDSERTAVEGDLGFRLGLDDISLLSGIGTGLNDGAGTPSLRWFLALHFSPRFHDADDDGVGDEEDECPHLPEDMDGFQDDDGCLDPDNDNDLIPDTDDRCPNEQAEEFRDEDEDGCTDPIRDGDGDGVEDDADACPRQAEDRDGHQDDDGCPDPDNDGDGVLDRVDRCPTEVEDRDGFRDHDGCPDPDNDGDGIADADDACPVAREDADGFEDEDGCPDPDNDRDGVSDADDRCPETAEVINGVSDDDGCPDRGGRSLLRARGERGSEEERLTGTVRFGADHAIAAASLPVLDQLARHIIARWPHRMRIAIPEDEPARRAAIAVALRQRRIPIGRFEVVSDATLRATQIVLSRVVAQESAEQTAAAAASGGQ